jgi:rhomboid protease GluP
MSLLSKFILCAVVSFFKLFFNSISQFDSAYGNFMNIDNLILWIVCISCGVLLVRAVRTGDRKGWTFVASAILVVTVLSLYFARSWASLIGGSLWFIFVLLPNILMQWINRLVYQQQYPKARKLAEFARWLHPTDGFNDYPKLLHSLEMAQKGNMARAREILDQYQDIRTPSGRYATVTLYKIDCQWEALLRWMQDSLDEKVFQKDRDLMMNYLRALGETGDLNGLVQGLERFEQIVDKTQDTESKHTMRMMVLAFCGEVESVKSLLASQPKLYSKESCSYWTATAEMAAGMELEANEKLMSLSRSPDISWQKAVAWRLNHSQRNRELTDSSKQILLQLTTDLHQEDRYGGAIKRTGKKAQATFGLIVLNVLAFVVEISMGKDETLYRFALLPTAVWDGEWWRMLSAMFLHVNFIHLALNMLGLYVLGEFVERTLGIRKYLIAYFFSGLGSMLTIAVLTMLFNHPNNFTVGASGAIMGIVGATAAILLKGWLLEKSLLAAKRLRSVLFIIGFQVVFDLSTPQISAVGHASGLILGFLISLFLVSTPKNRS